MRVPSHLPPAAIGAIHVPLPHARLLDPPHPYRRSRRRSEGKERRGTRQANQAFDCRPMIHLAIPLEPGNTRGPVGDMDGKVQGIITLESLVTENLGYAGPVNALKPLIEKPNPVAMSAWVRIGALDPDEWKPIL